MPFIDARETVKKIYIKNEHFLARDSSLNTFTNVNYELRIWQVVFLKIVCRIYLVRASYNVYIFMTNSKFVSLSNTKDQISNFILCPILQISMVNYK